MGITMGQRPPPWCPLLGDMNIDITPPTPMPGPSVRGAGGRGMGGWGDINIHIDINMNIHIIINMNIEDYVIDYLLFIIRYSGRYSLLGIPYIGPRNGYK